MDNNDFMEYNPSPFSNGFSMLNTYAEDLSKKDMLLILLLLEKKK